MSILTDGGVPRLNDFLETQFVTVEVDVFGRSEDRPPFGDDLALVLKVEGNGVFPAKFQQPFGAVSRFGPS